MDPVDDNRNMRLKTRGTYGEINWNPFAPVQFGSEMKPELQFGISLEKLDQFGIHDDGIIRAKLYFRLPGRIYPKFQDFRYRIGRCAFYNRHFDFQKCFFFLLSMEGNAIEHRIIWGLNVVSI